MLTTYDYIVIVSIHTQASTHIENTMVYIFYLSAISSLTYTYRKYNGIYFLSHSDIKTIYYYAHTI